MSPVKVSGLGSKHTIGQHVSTLSRKALSHCGIGIAAAMHLAGAFSRCEGSSRSLSPTNWNLLSFKWQLGAISNHTKIAAVPAQLGIRSTPCTPSLIASGVSKGLEVDG